MHNFMEAKLMAKLLRQALAEQGMQVTHSDSLELVARQFGLSSWNILSAKIEQASGAKDSELPRGWHTTGVSSRLYRTGIDKSLGAAWVESRPEYAELARNDEVFCTIMQSVDAAKFRGKRLRVSSKLKTDRVLGTATIWFRIDGRSGSLRFENLQRSQGQSGPLSGTLDWTEKAIVLDVPGEATTLNYGFLIQGTGKAWAKGFSLDEVDDSVPINTPAGYALSQPENLSFVDMI